jgi:hypothetical protein
MSVAIAGVGRESRRPATLTEQIALFPDLGGGPGNHAIR